MRLRKSKSYLFVALLFFIANLYSYYRMHDYSTIDDGFIYFGWPFDVYAEGGFVTTRVIIWTGIIGNLVLALCTARILTAVIPKFLGLLVKGRPKYEKPQSK